MYTLADKCQFQAQAIKQGQHKLAFTHLEILDWISKQFGVTALDFFCERRETSKGSPQQLVHMIMSTVDDVKQLHTDRAGSALIIEQFLNYFKSPGSHTALDPLKSNIFPVETNPFPEIIVTYRPLKSPDGKILNEMLEDEERAILKTFESVWTLSQGVVFYYTDEQVKENLANGTSEKINNELKQLARKYGFESGSPYRFDSKEYFDRDCGGNWYYYWK